MTIGLAMLVRDEAEGIVQCLESVKPLIDTWTIVDTGSTDGTKSLVAETLGDVEGALYDRPWMSFAHNRSELFELAKGSADYLLLLDADMVIHEEYPLPELEADCYNARLRDGQYEWRLPMLVRDGFPWRYEGAAHAYLTCDSQIGQENIDSFWVEHAGPGATREKIERDLEALKGETDPRSVFYLAQTYADLGEYDSAYVNYMKRSMMGGWDEEAYVALYEAGLIACEHWSFSEGAELLLKAWRLRQGRAEPLRALAQIANNVADKLAYTEDSLFVEPDAYRSPLRMSEVSAVIVTRGNVDLRPVLETIPFEDVVIWNNELRPGDAKAYGRYLAAEEAEHEVIFSVDDDVLFTRHEELVAAFEPGKVVANMDEAWLEGTGYGEAGVCQVGAGALWERRLAREAFSRYWQGYPELRRDHPVDWDFLITEADFIFGSLVPFKLVDLGYQTREFADAPDRLYQQPGQTERKWEAIRRAKALT